VAFDDAAFTRGHLTGERVEPEHPEAITGVEAVSLAWREREPITAFHRPDAYAETMVRDRLVRNPLLVEENGRLVPRWPSPKFAAEYAAADYLTGVPVPSADVDAVARGVVDDYELHTHGIPREAWNEGRRLIRRRIYLYEGDVV
jgi:hypothetical protein